MPIPKTNFHPPFNITRASHLVFTVRDLARSREFYTEVMGLIVSDEDANTLWLHGVEERAHHSLTLKQTTGQPQCERIGFRVFMDEDLEKAKAHFDKTGIKATFIEAPHQDRLVHALDSSRIKPDLRHQLQRARRAVAFGLPARNFQRLRDDLPRGKARVQRSCSVLKDHLHLCPFTRKNGA